MNIHKLSTMEGTSMQEMMASFETSFSYPLGDKSKFKISHGNDYSLFFRGMGENLTLIAERENQTIGTVAACLRKLELSNNETKNIAYIGDLKINKDLNLEGSRALLKLLKELQAWCKPRAQAALSVVMKGTSITPDSYSGRLGLTSFHNLGTISINEIAIESCDEEGKRYSIVFKNNKVSVTSLNEAKQLVKKLSAATELTKPRTNFKNCRSRMQPIWIKSSSNNAIACLEDTRRAKRLYKEDGKEILNCHLSNFYFNDKEEAREVLKYALALSRALDFDALFLSLDNARQNDMAPVLKELNSTQSTAIIYGTSNLKNHKSAANWYINSSEI